MDILTFIVLTLQNTESTVNVADYCNQRVHYLNHSVHEVTWNKNLWMWMEMREMVDSLAPFTVDECNSFATLFPHSFDMVSFKCGVKNYLEGGQAKGS